MSIAAVADSDERLENPTQTLIFDDGSICSRCLFYRKRQLSEHERERYRPHNEIGHPPDRLPTDSRAWFCRCGAESAFDRDLEVRELPTGVELRVDPHTRTEERFHAAIKRCICSLEAVGHDVDRQRFATYALHAWKHDLWPVGLGERRLEDGLDEAIVHAVDVNES